MYGSLRPPSRFASHSRSPAVGEAASLCHTEAGVQHGVRRLQLSRDYSLSIHRSGGSSQR